jgi:LysR family transcriptional regulator, hydrogen peroxide-inducible genes activator
MTLRELRYLVALAEHRHFGHAAEACHVTQPTLSTQLRKLEDYLGLALLDRSGKQPSLTPIGELVVERARRLLAEADQILELKNLRSGPLQGALNIGLIPTLAPYYLPWLLPLVRQRYPKLRLVVHEEMTRHLADKLADQMIDVAIVALPGPLPPPAFVEQALFDEPFFVAAPPHHEIAAYDAVPLEALAELKLLLLTDGHCLRGHALEACGQHESAQDDGCDFRASSLETLRQLVAAGMGCTLMPALSVRRRGDSGLVVRPLAQGQARRIGMVWRAGHQRAADLQLLADALGDALPEGVRPLRRTLATAA